MATLLLASCAPDQLKTPKDAIVSTTLCADGYLHSLPKVEPRLAALSWQSRSILSQTPQHLRHLPQATHDPESLVKWREAIQVTSAGGQGQIDLNWGEDFETVWTNFAMLAAYLKVDDPSSEFQARLKAIHKLDKRLRILYLDRSGATAGQGTFVNAVIDAAGGENIIQNPGWQSPDTETLMSLKPDIILTSFMNSNYAGVNDRTSRHSALAAKISSLPVIEIPGRLWPCAGPGLVEAAERLNQGMAKL
jgi:iron complex transport system substrate-binding protein